MTLSTMTLSIMTFSTLTLSITIQKPTLILTLLSIITFSITIKTNTFVLCVVLLFLCWMLWRHPWHVSTIRVPLFANRKLHPAAARRSSPWVPISRAAPAPKPRAARWPPARPRTRTRRTRRRRRPSSDWSGKVSHFFALDTEKRPLCRYFSRFCRKAATVCHSGCGFLLFKWFRF
jgi:hypothetical protein